MHLAQAFPLRHLGEILLTANFNLSHSEGVIRDMVLCWRGKEVSSTLLHSTRLDKLMTLGHKVGGVKPFLRSSWLCTYWPPSNPFECNRRIDIYRASFFNTTLYNGKLSIGVLPPKFSRVSNSLWQQFTLRYKLQTWLLLSLKRDLMVLGRVQI
jgi:hypothetical protein